MPEAKVSAVSYFENDRNDLHVELYSIYLYTVSNFSGLLKILYYILNVFEMKYFLSRFVGKKIK